MAKIKMKSHRGASKRFKLTKSGKVKRAHASKSHLAGGKKRKRLRRLKKMDYIDKTQSKLIRGIISKH